MERSALIQFKTGKVPYQMGGWLAHCFMTQNLAEPSFQFLTHQGHIVAILNLKAKGQQVADQAARVLPVENGKAGPYPQPLAVPTQDIQAQGMEGRDLQASDPEARALARDPEAAARVIETAHCRELVGRLPDGLEYRLRLDPTEPTQPMEVVKYPDPSLRRGGRPIETFDQELRDTARAMLDTMYEQRGVGLAAVLGQGLQDRLVIEAESTRNLAAIYEEVASLGQLMKPPGLISKTLPPYALAPREDGLGDGTEGAASAAAKTLEPAHPPVKRAAPTFCRPGGLNLSSAAL